MRITNEGAEDYPLGAVTVSSQWVKGTDGCGAKTLAAGASCDVEVTFAPTTGGVKTGFVMIANHKPHLIALAGVGTEAVAALSPAVADLSSGPADVHAAQLGQRGAQGRHGQDRRGLRDRRRRVLAHDASPRARRAR